MVNAPTGAGHGFCGHCGSALPGAVRFCPSCGQALAAPASQSPAYLPPATPPSYEQFGWGQPPPRPGRRRTLLLAGGLGVLLLAGGSVAAVLLLGGSDSRLVGGGALPGAVTQEPEEQWSWSSSEMVAGGTAVGDVLVVGSAGGEGVTALDENGEELWTSDVGDYAASFAQFEDVVFISSFEDSGVTAVSIDDGEELWSFDDGYLAYPTEEGVVFSNYEDQELALLDVSTGDERWSVSGVDSSAATEDAVYVLDGGQLSRIALDSGDEEWTVRTDFDSDDEEGYVSLAATDDMVVLSDDEVVAFDAGDGAELWSEYGGPDGSELGIYSSSRVYVVASDYSLDEPVFDVTVFDRDGRVGDLDLDEGDYFSARAFEVDGTAYAFDQSSNRIFDEELEEVGQYDGQVILVDGGLYTLEEDGELSFYEHGSASPEWSIDTAAYVSEEFGASVIAFDGRVVALAEDEVVSYK